MTMHMLTLIWSIAILLTLITILSGGSAGFGWFL